MKNNKEIVIKHKFRTYRQKKLFLDLCKEDQTLGMNYLDTLKGQYRIKVKNQIAQARRLDQFSQNEDKLSKRTPNFWFDQVKKLYNPLDNHKPLDLQLGQWIGVEIECFIPYDSVNVEYECNCECACEHDEAGNTEYECSLCSNGCDGECNGGEDRAHTALAKLITHKKIKRVSVKGDGSIRQDDGCFAVELTCLFTRQDRSNLKKLCELLDDLGAQVNKSCGMHVHFDQRDVLNDLEKRKILNRRKNNLNKSIPFLASMVPISRRQNSYCRLVSSSRDRYSAINLCALKRYKSIEVRLHSSTTNFDKINNWINILALIIDSDRLKKQVMSLDDFCTYLNVPEHLILYAQSRIEKFKGVENEDNTETLDSDMTSNVIQLPSSITIDSNNIVIGA